MLLTSARNATATADLLTVLGVITLFSHSNQLSESSPQLPPEQLTQEVKFTPTELLLGPPPACTLPSVQPPQPPSPLRQQHLEPTEPPSIDAPMTGVTTALPTSETNLHCKQGKTFPLPTAPSQTQVL